jgi:hypothetical protein
MNTNEIEPRRSMFARWKLNLVIFLLFFVMIALTIIIGSLNQINKNINSVSSACLLSELPSTLSVQSKRK